MILVSYTMELPFRLTFIIGPDVYEIEFLVWEYAQILFFFFFLV